MQERDTNFSDIINSIKEYTEIKIELLRLETIDKLSTVASGIFTILFSFLFITFIFFSLYICASLYIGKYMNDYALGFALSGIGCILLLTLYWLIFKRITKNFISKKLISLFTSYENESAI